eukprot:13887170-Alexandrium_andersonii.AAC.1
MRLRTEERSHPQAMNAHAHPQAIMRSALGLALVAPSAAIIRTCVNTSQRGMHVRARCGNNCNGDVVMALASCNDGDGNSTSGLLPNERATGA